MPSPTSPSIVADRERGSRSSVGERGGARPLHGDDIHLSEHTPSHSLEGAAAEAGSAEAVRALTLELSPFNSMDKQTNDAAAAAHSRSSHAHPPLLDVSTEVRALMWERWRCVCKGVHLAQTDRSNLIRERAAMRTSGRLSSAGGDDASNVTLLFPPLQWNHHSVEPPLHCL
jgi:hypothetical protein